MNFIKLNDIDSGPVLINPMQIVAVEPDDDKSMILMTLSPVGEGRYTYIVSESLDEIQKLVSQSHVFPPPPATPQH